MTDTIDTAPGLTTEQVERFWEQGFIHNIPILTERQTRIARRKFEDLEAQARAAATDRWTDPGHNPWNTARHPIQHWCRAMSTHPRILAVVSAVLGPNLLIRNADVFIKEPENTRRITWHVDSAAEFETARFMITAWLGMTESTTENGCMDFIPRSHRQDMPRGPTDKSNLTFRGSTLDKLESGERVANVMRPGCMSLHCFRTIHRSGGNFTQERRFGYVTRFMAPTVTPEASECGTAYLAQGENEPARLSIQPFFPISWMRNTGPSGM